MPLIRTASRTFGVRTGVVLLLVALSVLPGCTPQILGLRPSQRAAQTPSNRLVFTTAPSNSTTAGSTLATQPVVTAEDPQGNTLTAFTDNVALSAYTDSSCSTAISTTPNGSNPLDGITTESAVLGVATFSTIQINQAGTVYIRAEATGLTSACSGAITVSADTPRNSESTTSVSKSIVLANDTATSIITVTLKDTFGNPVPSTAVSLTSSRVGLDTITPASGTTNSSGQTTFTVKSGTVGTSTFTANDDDNSISLADTASVGFYNQGFSILYEITDYNLGGSTSALTLLDGVFYGTNHRGPTGQGSVFRIEPNGTGFQTILFFNGTNGESPQNPPLALNGSLYGTTSSGGDNNLGTIFKLEPDGTLTTLHSFDGTDGSSPYSSLTLLGGALYGTTASGGSSNLGTVFKINSDGSGFSSLHSFDGANGSNVRGSLTVSGGSLYGTTNAGGTNNFGTVYKINPDGSGFSSLHSFDGTNGKYATNSLTVAAGALYGSTTGSGVGDYGTIFKINTDGTGFMNLHSFNDANGRTPHSLLLSGGSIFGATSSGGASSLGTLFSIGTDGLSFTSLHSLDGIVAGVPSSGLVEYDGVFYGTTSGTVGIRNPTVFIYIP